MRARVWIAAALVAAMVVGGAVLQRRTAELCLETEALVRRGMEGADGEVLRQAETRWQAAQPYLTGPFFRRGRNRSSGPSWRPPCGSWSTSVNMTGFLSKLFFNPMKRGKGRKIRPAPAQSFGRFAEQKRRSVKGYMQFCHDAGDFARGNAKRARICAKCQNSLLNFGKNAIANQSCNSIFPVLT